MSNVSSSGPNLDQFQFVANLLQRQEDVLEQIAQLQSRIDEQIKEANQRDEDEQNALITSDAVSEEEE